MATRKLSLLISTIPALSMLGACARTASQAPSPVYARVVRAALPHDLNPRDSVACIGAHNDKGELYDLGCNEALEQEPMVGMYRATFSENPDKDPQKLGIFDNVAGSVWRCHFAADDVELICERIKK